MTPKGNVSFTLTKMENAKGETIIDAKGSGHKVAIELESDLDLSFGIIMRYLDEDGTTRQPFNQSSTKAQAV